MNQLERSSTDILFFDTETTGLPLFKEPSGSEGQPHMVELAGLRYTQEGVLVGAVSQIIKPEGWVIPQETIDVHGITNEIAHEKGSSEVLSLAAFMALYEGCSLRVAHNLNFDNRIIRIALMRYAGEEEANAFKALPGECTALLSKPVCKLPPTEAMKRSSFKNNYKTPTLAEAFKFLSGGKELGTQHRAFDDAQACARVYFMLKGIRMPEFPDDVCALREEEPQELSL